MSEKKQQHANNLKHVAIYDISHFAVAERFRLDGVGRLTIPGIPLLQIYVRTTKT